MQQVMHQKNRRQHQKPGDVVVRNPIGQFSRHAYAGSDAKGGHVRQAVGASEDPGSQCHFVDYRTEPESGHGQVMTAQPQHGQADKQGDEDGDAHGPGKPEPRVEPRDLRAVGVAIERQSSGLYKEPSEPAAGESGKIRCGKCSRYVSANGEETGVTEGYLAGISHEHAQPHRDDGVIRRHGELRKIKRLARGRQPELNSGHEKNQNGK